MKPVYNGHDTDGHSKLCTQFNKKTTSACPRSQVAGQHLGMRLTSALG